MEKIICESPWRIVVKVNVDEGLISLAFNDEENCNFEYKIPKIDAVCLINGGNKSVESKPSHSREIERKFRIKFMPNLDGVKSYDIMQGYLADGFWVIRARVKGSRGYLTLKGNGTDGGIGVDEFEYEISALDAAQMIKFAPFNKLIKVRHEIEYKGHVWELDEFKDKLVGLELVEIELKEVDETFEIPEWVGVEVSGNKVYFNKNLANLDKWEEPM